MSVTVEQVAVGTSAIFLTFIIIETLKSWLNPPYALKADCIRKHDDAGKKFDKIESKIDDMSGRMDEKMDHIVSLIVGGKK